MTGLVWVQQDAPQYMRDLLRRIIGKTHADMVRSEVPDKWTPAKGTIITVVSDGTPLSETGWTIENVRVAVRAHDGPTARSIMSALDADLLTPRNRINFKARISPGAGLICIKDSRLGGWLSTATYEVAMNRKVAGKWQQQ